MATSARASTDADVFTELLSGGESTFNPDVARWVLSLRFTERQQARMQRLAELGNERGLNDAERSEAERYSRIGTMLSTLHSRARLALQESVRSE